MDLALLEEFGLDPDVLHLNHGAFGVAPISVRRRAEAWRDRAERNPNRFNSVELRQLVPAARAKAAAWLGVDADSVGWVRNVSEGASAVISSLDLEPGDEIVVCNHGYGAVRMAAEHWAGRRAASVRQAEFPLGAEDEEIVAAYAAACGPRTRLVIVDQITSPTATVLPVSAIAAAVSAPVLVDAAHVPGTLRTDIAGLGAAYWVGNLHKWGFTPRGTAVLWTRAELRAGTPPSVLSWQLHDGYSESFDHPGTWDYAAWLAAPDGLDFWTGLGGWEQIGRQGALLDAAQKQLADALGTSLDGLPVNPAPTMRIVRLPERIFGSDDDPKARAERDRLDTEFNIQVPLHRFGDEPIMRIAGAAYNTADDYERLADALIKINS
ncbi:MAG: aminotransferase class V-fold PLP-dependent enzyme [Microlunatus sp.]|nr:aminotransferase class V-fold PLP-dependent enzyme [Microlunatus sp.]